MDLDLMRETVAAIPPGAWMSYGDVAAAAGGSDVHARTLNQRFIREDLSGAHRVLKSDGTIGGAPPGEPPAGPGGGGGGGGGGCGRRPPPPPPRPPPPPAPPAACPGP